MVSMNEISELKNTFDQAKDLFNKIQDILEQRGSNAATDGTRRILGFAQQLAKKYPDDFDLYVTYHAITFSTPPFDDKIPDRRPVTKLDFPEDDSVMKYLQKYRRELLSS